MSAPVDLPPRLLSAPEPALPEPELTEPGIRNRRRKLPCHSGVNRICRKTSPYRIPSLPLFASKFHAPVTGAAFECVVGFYWTRRAGAVGREPIGNNLITRDQCVFDGCGTAR